LINNVPPAEHTTQDQPESPGSDEPDSSPTGQDAAHPDQAINVHCLNNTDTDEPTPPGWLETHLTRAAQLSGVKNAQLSIAIVNDEEMAQLHEQYTGVSGTTDVLTFDLSDEPEPDLGDDDSEPSPQPTDIEGDIVICLDEARRQADKRGHPAHHELLLYAVHGLLHLLGEDDHDPDDYQRMHAREDELLGKLGLGPIFKTDTPNGGAAPACADETD